MRSATAATSLVLVRHREQNRVSRIHRMCCRCYERGSPTGIPTLKQQINLQSFVPWFRRSRRKESANKLQDRSLTGVTGKDSATGSADKEQPQSTCRYRFDVRSTFAFGGGAVLTKPPVFDYCHLVWTTQASKH
jgi:hypothetical protein